MKYSQSSIFNSKIIKFYKYYQVYITWLMVIGKNIKF